MATWLGACASGQENLPALVDILSRDTKRNPVQFAPAVLHSLLPRSGQDGESIREWGDIELDRQWNTQCPPSLPV